MEVTSNMNNNNKTLDNQTEDTSPVNRQAGSGRVTTSRLDDASWIQRGEHTTRDTNVHLREKTPIPKRLSRGSDDSGWIKSASSSGRRAITSEDPWLRSPLVRSRRSASETWKVPNNTEIATGSTTTRAKLGLRRSAGDAEVATASGSSHVLNTPLQTGTSSTEGSVTTKHWTPKETAAISDQPIQNHGFKDPELIAVDTIQTRHAPGRLKINTADAQSWIKADTKDMHASRSSIPEPIRITTSMGIATRAVSSHDGPTPQDLKPRPSSIGDVKLKRETFERSLKMSGFIQGNHERDLPTRSTVRSEFSLLKYESAMAKFEADRNKNDGKANEEPPRRFERRGRSIGRLRDRELTIGGTIETEGHKSRSDTYASRSQDRTSRRDGHLISNEVNTFKRDLHTFTDDASHTGGHRFRREDRSSEGRSFRGDGEIARAKEHSPRRDEHRFNDNTSTSMGDNVSGRGGQGRTSRRDGHIARSEGHISKRDRHTFKDDTSSSSGHVSRRDNQSFQSNGEVSKTEEHAVRTEGETIIDETFGSTEDHVSSKRGHKSRQDVHIDESNGHIAQSRSDCHSSVSQDGITSSEDPIHGTDNSGNEDDIKERELDTSKNEMQITSIKSEDSVSLSNTVTKEVAIEQIEAPPANSRNISKSEIETKSELEFQYNDDTPGINTDTEEGVNTTIVEGLAETGSFKVVDQSGIDDNPTVIDQLELDPTLTSVASGLDECLPMVKQTDTTSTIVNHSDCNDNPTVTSWDSSPTMVEQSGQDNNVDSWPPVVDQSIVDRIPTLTEQSNLKESLIMLDQNSLAESTAAVNQPDLNKCSTTVEDQSEPAELNQTSSEVRTSLDGISEGDQAAGKGDRHTRRERRRRQRDWVVDAAEEVPRKGRRRDPAAMLEEKSDVVKQDNTTAMVDDVADEVVAYIDKGTEQDKAVIERDETEQIDIPVKEDEIEETKVTTMNENTTDIMFLMIDENTSINDSTKMDAISDMIESNVAESIAMIASIEVSDNQAEVDSSEFIETSAMVDNKPVDNGIAVEIETMIDNKTMAIDSSPEVNRSDLIVSTEIINNNAIDEESASTDNSMEVVDSQEEVDSSAGHDSSVDESSEDISTDSKVVPQIDGVPEIDGEPENMEPAVIISEPEKDDKPSVMEIKAPETSPTSRDGTSSLSKEDTHMAKHDNIQQYPHVEEIWEDTKDQYVINDVCISTTTLKLRTESKKDDFEVQVQATDVSDGIQNNMISNYEHEPSVESPSVEITHDAMPSNNQQSADVEGDILPDHASHGNLLDKQLTLMAGDEAFSTDNNDDLSAENSLPCDNGEVDMEVCEQPDIQTHLSEEEHVDEVLEDLGQSIFKTVPHYEEQACSMLEIQQVDTETAIQHQSTTEEEIHVPDIEEHDVYSLLCLKDEDCTADIVDIVEYEETSNWVQEEQINNETTTAENTDHEMLKEPEETESNEREKHVVVVDWDEWIKENKEDIKAQEDESSEDTEEDKTEDMVEGQLTWVTWGLETIEENVDEAAIQELKVKKEKEANEETVVCLIEDTEGIECVEERGEEEDKCQEHNEIQNKRDTEDMVKIKIDLQCEMHDEASIIETEACQYGSTPESNSEVDIHKGTYDFKNKHQSETCDLANEGSDENNEHQIVVHDDPIDLQNKELNPAGLQIETIHEIQAVQSKPNHTNTDFESDMHDELQYNFNEVQSVDMHSTSIISDELQVKGDENNVEKIHSEIVLEHQQDQESEEPETHSNSNIETSQESHDAETFCKLIETEESLVPHTEPAVQDRNNNQTDAVQSPNNNECHEISEVSIEPCFVETLATSTGKFIHAQAEDGIALEDDHTCDVNTISQSPTHLISQSNEAEAVGEQVMEKQQIDVEECDVVHKKEDEEYEEVTENSTHSQLTDENADEEQVMEKQQIDVEECDVVHKKEDEEDEEYEEYEEYEEVTENSTHSQLTDEKAGPQTETINETPSGINNGPGLEIEMLSSSDIVVTTTLSEEVSSIDELVTHIPESQTSSSINELTTHPAVPNKVLSTPGTLSEEVLNTAELTESTAIPSQAADGTLSVDLKESTGIDTPLPAGATSQDAILRARLSSSTVRERPIFDNTDGKDDNSKTVGHSGQHLDVIRSDMTAAKKYVEATRGVKPKLSKPEPRRAKHREPTEEEVQMENIVMWLSSGPTIRSDASDRTMLMDNGDVSFEELILEVFEESETLFFPLQAQKEARAFIKALHMKGITYESLCQEIGEHEHNFTSWRKSLGRAGVGHTVMSWVNQPLQQLLDDGEVDGEDEDDGMDDAEEEMRREAERREEGQRRLQSNGDESHNTKKALDFNKNDQTDNHSAERNGVSGASRNAKKESVPAHTTKDEPQLRQKYEQVPDPIRERRLLEFKNQQAREHEPEGDNVDQGVTDIRDRISQFESTHRSPSKSGSESREESENGERLDENESVSSSGRTETDSVSSMDEPEKPADPFSNTIPKSSAEPALLVLEESAHQKVLEVQTTSNGSKVAKFPPISVEKAKDVVDGTLDINENYNSDLDVENDKHSPMQALAARKIAESRAVKTWGGFLYVFSDTPANSNTCRVKVGASTFPHKRLRQAQLFNPDIYQVRTVAVKDRATALKRVLQELEPHRLPGKQDWFEGPFNDILSAIAEVAACFPSSRKIIQSTNEEELESSC